MSALTRVISKCGVDCPKAKTATKVKAENILRIMLPIVLIDIHRPSALCLTEVAVVLRNNALLDVLTQPSWSFFKDFQCRVSAAMPGLDDRRDYPAPEFSDPQR